MDYVIAPKGVRRVGTIVKSSAKQGCTLMVTAEYNTGTLANPFVVMTGTTGPTGHLEKEYSDWGKRHPDNTCHIAFQKKHWFDTAITIRYLKWLRELYPDKMIFLIWDHAPAHDAADVQAFIREAEAEG